MMFSSSLCVESVNTYVSFCTHVSLAILFNVCRQMHLLQIDVVLSFNVFGILYSKHSWAYFVPIELFIYSTSFIIFYIILFIILYTFICQLYSDLSESIQGLTPDRFDGFVEAAALTATAFDKAVAQFKAV